MIGWTLQDHIFSYEEYNNDCITNFEILNQNHITSCTEQNGKIQIARTTGMHEIALESFKTSMIFSILSKLKHGACLIHINGKHTPAPKHTGTG